MSSRQGVRSSNSKLFLHVQQTLAIVEADMRKLQHDPYELFTRMIQPAIWLLIFGQSLAKAHAIPTSGVPYLDFMTPGILAQSILFIAIFYGIALIWERDMGILHKIMVSPAPRVTLVLGRALSAGIRGLSQVFIVYILALILGIDLRWNPLSLLVVICMIVVGAAVFSTFSLIIAAIVKTRERFMGIGQVLTMPLFFASNALYPIEIMPGWIKVISVLNPLTYQVDALRSQMIVGETTHFGLGVDFLVNFIYLFLFVVLATRIYPKILY